MNHSKSEGSLLSQCKVYFTTIFGTALTRNFPLFPFKEEIISISSFSKWLLQTNNCAMLSLNFLMYGSQISDQSLCLWRSCNITFKNQNQNKSKIYFQTKFTICLFTYIWECKKMFPWLFTNTQTTFSRHCCNVVFVYFKQQTTLLHNLTNNKTNIEVMFTLRVRSQKPTQLHVFKRILSFLYIIVTRVEKRDATFFGSVSRSDDFAIASFFNERVCVGPWRVT